MATGENADTMKPKTRSVRLRITGRVQGVWFRKWTTTTASGLGLTGWVRNRRDGSVEVLATGAADAVDTLIQRCHEGPAAARVDAVTTAEDTDPGLTDFEQWPTA